MQPPKPCLPVVAPRGNLRTLALKLQASLITNNNNYITNNFKPARAEPQELASNSRLDTAFEFTFKIRRSVRISKQFKIRHGVRIHIQD